MTKIKQIANSEQNMAIQICVDDNMELYVNLRILPNFNQKAKTVDAAKEKLLKRKKAPTWTDQEENSLNEIKQKILNDDLAIQSVLE